MIQKRGKTVCSKKREREKERRKTEKSSKIANEIMKQEQFYFMGEKKL